MPLNRRVQRRIATAAALAMIVAGLATPVGVSAAVVLDQSQLVRNVNIAPSINTYVGQSFTAGKTGRLVRVSIWPVSDLNGKAIEIRTTSGGLPTVTVIGSGTVGSSATEQWVDVDLAVPAAVTSGIQYAFVVPVSGGGTLGGNGSPASYAGGALVADTNVWTAFPFDLTFRTYVDVLPDLAITENHLGNFHVGQNGTYAIHVTSTGTGATSGLVTVTDAIWPTMTLQGISAPGWTCSQKKTVVTCTRSDGLAPGGSYPDIQLTVRPNILAVGTSVNVAVLQNASDTNPANNTATDVTRTVF